jgi:hypothetical protein
MCAQVRPVDVQAALAGQAEALAALKPPLRRSQTQLPSRSPLSAPSAAAAPASAQVESEVNSWVISLSLTLSLSLHAFMCPLVLTAPLCALLPFCLRHAVTAPFSTTHRCLIVRSVSSLAVPHLLHLLPLPLVRCPLHVRPMQWRQWQGRLLYYHPPPLCTPPRLRGGAVCLQLAMLLLHCLPPNTRFRPPNHRHSKEQWTLTAASAV